MGKVDKLKIDNELADYFLNNLGISSFDFSTGYDTEIVPKEFTHNELLNRFNVSDTIQKQYFSYTEALLTKELRNKLLKSGFIGNIEKALYPYSIIINGAYYLRNDLHVKLLSSFYNNPKIKDKEIKYFNDLVPYFNNYSQGFKKGYNELENSKILPFIPSLLDKKDYAKKIYEFITFNRGNFEFISSFTVNGNNEIINGFENGLMHGYNYKAWSIVFSNSELFEPLFNIPDAKKKEKPIKQLPIKTYYLKPNEVDRLFEMLIKSYTKGAEKTDFKKIFNEQPFNKINKIIWTGSIASLKYFVGKMDFSDTETKEKLLQGDKYYIATLCFLDQKGETITDKHFRSHGSPTYKDQNKLDNIIKEIKA